MDEFDSIEDAYRFFTEPGSTASDKSLLSAGLVRLVRTHEGSWEGSFWTPSRGWTTDDTYQTKEVALRQSSRAWRRTRRLDHPCPSTYGDHRCGRTAGHRGDHFCGAYCCRVPQWTDVVARMDQAEA